MDPKKHIQNHSNTKVAIGDERPMLKKLTCYNSIIYIRYILTTSTISFPLDVLSSVHGYVAY